MSTLRVDNVTPAAGGTAYNLNAGVAKAFMNYDHTTPAIDQDNNVTSVTDNSVGNFTMNFTNNMAAEYAVSGQSGNGATSTTGIGMRPVTHTVSSLTAISTANTAGIDTYQDYQDVSVIIFGDLA